MTNSIVIEHNVATGEITEREMTAKETADRQAQESAALQAEATKAGARQAILDRLGLTADEAQLLLGGN